MKLITDFSSPPWMVGSYSPSWAVWLSHRLFSVNVAEFGGIYVGLGSGSNPTAFNYGRFGAWVERHTPGSRALRIRAWFELYVEVWRGAA